MNVVFLDYDGVVNTPMWTPDGKRCCYNFPNDGSVNNFQAVQWLSEFCEKHGYDIVVSSSWRTADNYQECLKNGGLRDSIRILGRTPLPSSGRSRGAEITQWLDEHPDVENYVILDDEMFKDFKELHLLHHVVLCDPVVGMTEYIHDELERGHTKGAFAVT